MKLEDFNKHQRISLKFNYGDLYVKNEVYFQQYFCLQQGTLTVDEYLDQFSRLQKVCDLDENDEHYLISFIGHLRPSILKNMEDYNASHEAYWEAIHVERMLTCYRL